jgi:hypothetical protein
LRVEGVGRWRHRRLRLLAPAAALGQGVEELAALFGSVDQQRELGAVSGSLVDYFIEKVRFGIASHDDVPDLVRTHPSIVLGASHSHQR